MHHNVERIRDELLVPKASNVPSTEKVVLEKLCRAIDLARIVRHDSIRSGRRRTVAAGHINNLETLLKDLKKSLEQ